jgi:MFS family permease
MRNEQEKPKNTMLFRDVNFRWLLSGGLLSMLGDQFTLIALPWLALKMSGDTLVLGTVLSLVGVPRAVFILIGGALADRYSPKRVLMMTKYINTILLGTLAILVLSNGLNIWLLYVLSLAIGFATAFSIPAGSSILPHVVQTEQLQAANSAMMGVRQATMFAGPLLAGLLIAIGGNNGGAVAAAANTKGLGLAFLFDAFSFIISALTLAKVTVREAPAHTDPANQSHLLKSAAENLRYCWNDIELRTCFLYWAVIALFISGPIQVAMPVLANTLNLGAAAYGILMGAHGAGTLIGMVISGAKPNLRLRSLGLTLLFVDAVIGILIAAMGLISTTLAGAILLLVIGTMGGFVQVAIFTWMQRRVPASRMGRTMSVFMFIFMGIAPISAAITGWVMRSTTVSQLFGGSGLMLLAIATIAWAASPMKTVSDSRVQG